MAAAIDRCLDKVDEVNRQLDGMLADLRVVSAEARLGNQRVKMTMIGCYTLVAIALVSSLAWFARVH